MLSRQMDKTKLLLCAKLRISTETFDALIDYINNEKKVKEKK